MYSKSYLNKNIIKLSEINNNFKKLFLLIKIFDLDCFILGGGVRFLLENNIPRDIDIIVKTSNEFLKSLIYYNFDNVFENNFGGFKISNIIDIWTFDSHYLFRTNIYEKSVDNILYTTFNSYDSILYDLKYKILYDDFFLKTLMDNKIELIGKEDALLSNPNVYFSFFKLLYLEYIRKFKLSSLILDFFYFLFKEKFKLYNGNILKLINNAFFNHYKKNMSIDLYKYVYFKINKF